LSGLSPGPCHLVVGFKGGLLDLGVVIGVIAVQHQLSHLDQRVVGVWPHLGQIKRVEPVGLGVLERHDLHLQRPTGVIATLDRLMQVAGVVVPVDADQPVGLGLGEALDALIGDEMVFDPEGLLLGVNPTVGVGSVAVNEPRFPQIGTRG
jgi:hypothetical protein